MVIRIEEFIESLEAKKAAAAAAYQEELRMRAKEAAERREKARPGGALNIKEHFKQPTIPKSSENDDLDVETQ